MVSTRFALSLVSSAFGALYRLVSLVAAACASLAATFVTIGSLVKSYVCAVHRRLTWTLVSHNKTSRSRTRLDTPLTPPSLACRSGSYHYFLCIVWMYPF